MWKNNLKEAEIMNQITKEEAMYLSGLGIHCPKTCRLKRKGKKRGKYFAPDDKGVMQLLENYRASVKIVESYPISFA